jgi:oligoendopeptidase F
MRIRHLFPLGVALAVLAPAAALPFEPVPQDEKPLYRFDLAGRFYADAAAWDADAQRLRTLAGAVEARRGRLLDSPADLLAAVEAQAESADLSTKLYAYGAFRAAVDTKDQAYAEDYRRLKAETDARTAFVRSELAGLTRERLGEFIRQEPRLAPYRYALEDVVRLRPHLLSEDQESLLARLQPDLAGWQAVLFQAAFDRTSFPALGIPGRQETLPGDYEALLRDPDRGVRERAFRGYFAGLASLRDLAGFALLREMRALNAQAQMRGFPTYYDESLFRRHLTPAQVETLYAQIERRLPLYREYLAVRRERVRRRLNLPACEIWDEQAPSGSGPLPRLDVARASALVRESLGGLGPEYARTLNRFLAPGSGCLDLVGGPGRTQGAFCEGYFGVYMEGFSGSLTDTSTLAHEMGHAVYYQMLKDRTGSLLFGEGPKYMSESFSMFNEWLVRDRLIGREKDSALRKACAEEALDEAMMLFELARRARFEQVCYSRVASGRIADEKGFDEACLDTGIPCDPYFERYPELRVHWIRKHHYWTVPTYYLNYVVAHVLAMKYHELYLKDPAGFSKKYVDMMSAGFDRPAAERLKDYLGIDLEDPAFLDGAFALMERRLEEAKKAEN